MKKLLLLGLIALIGCEMHQVEPKVEELSLSVEKILQDSISGYFYDEDTMLIESLTVEFNILRDDIYLLDINGKAQEILLTTGLHSYSYPVDDIVDLSSGSIEISLGVPRFPKEIQRLSYTVEGAEVPFLVGFTPEFPSIIEGNENGVIYSPFGDALDSLTFSFMLLVANEYSIRINDFDTTVNLELGQNAITVPVETFVGDDSIHCSIGKPDVLEEMIQFSFPVNFGKAIDFDDPFLKYAWQIGTTDPELLAEKQIEHEANASVKPAWFHARGTGVTVAVIDVDFEQDHEDLQANIVGVYNALHDNDQLMNPGGIFHGTGVSGVIGAVPDNATGIVGVAPEANLILIDAPYGITSETLRAFDYAEQAGAKVINCSWGTYNVGEEVANKIKELYEKGITIVFAAGNESSNLDVPDTNDESELPWVIGVGSSDQHNDFWSGSDYGKELDVIAPGGSPEAGVLRLDGTGTTGLRNRTYDFVNENYAFHYGCSYAAPLVAGVAALMLEVNPSLSPDDIREILKQSADKVGGEYLYDQNGFELRRAHGKVNAEAAVLLAKEWM